MAVSKRRLDGRLASAAAGGGKVPDRGSHTSLGSCCASQQVCNAVYLRLNFSVPLCACPEPGDPCSASTLHTDNHSLRLSADTEDKQVREDGRTGGL